MNEMKGMWLKMKNKGAKILIIILIIIILATGGAMAYKILKDKQNTSTEVSERQEENILTAGVEEKKVFWRTFTNWCIST